MSSDLYNCAVDIGKEGVSFVSVNLYNYCAIDIYKIVLGLLEIFLNFLGGKSETTVQQNINKYLDSSKYVQLNIVITININCQSAIYIFLVCTYLILIKSSSAGHYLLMFHVMACSQLYALDPFSIAMEIKRVLTNSVLT